MTPRRNSKDQLASQPIQIFYKMTKKRPDLLKKALLNKNSAKKSPNIQKIEFWQAPND
jgi:hypothetical protein